MRPISAIASLVLALFASVPPAAAAHERGQPAEFPRWRGTPELTVYAPVPGRPDVVPWIQPVAAQPAPPVRAIAPQPC
jgi:hypothetical protein